MAISVKNKSQIFPRRIFSAPAKEFPLEIRKGDTPKN